MPQLKSQRRGKGFFDVAPTAEDEAARQREVASLLPPRRIVIQDLPVERIRPNPFQARQHFTNLEELNAAIQAQGFITRLRVRPDPAEDGYFQLAFGERRLRAARLAGLSEVPCEVAEHTDDELLEIGLAENIQRRDLEPMDEARAFQMFIDGRGYSIRRLAERIGKDKSYVQDRLALLSVPEDVQRMIEQRPDALRIAREIGKLATPQERQPLIEEVMSGKLNTEDVRNIVRAVTTPTTTPAVPVAPAPDVVAESADPPDLPDPVGLTTGNIEGAVSNVRTADTAADTHADISESLHKQRAARSERPVEREKPLAAGMEREMGTIRVILARWQNNLPNLTVGECAVLAGYLEEISEIGAQLRKGLRGRKG